MTLRQWQQKIKFVFILFIQCTLIMYYISCIIECVIQLNFIAQIEDRLF